jgi:YVTN family beta-propeller protein
MSRREVGARTPQRFLATVLFTDIVGSTERAVALGDRRWRELLERHHEAVREELRRFGGREIDTAGDGFFAAFASPAQAVACAARVVGRLHDLGIEVRAGLHMGECEVVGDKIGGIAVHIGARVAGRAASGEVLVTGTLRELVQGSGIQFEDRGAAELKGVPGEWHLYAVTDATAVEPAPAFGERGRGPLAQLPLPARTGQGPRAARWPRLIAAFVALALVAVGATFVFTRGGTTSTLKAIDVNSVGRIDPATGRVTDQVTVGARPAGVAFGAGSLWITNEGDGSVSRIDPDAVRVLQTVGNVGNDPLAVAADDDGVWVANGEDGTLARISPETNQVLDRIPVGNGPSAVALGGGYVWVSNMLAASISRVDPGGGVPRSFEVQDRPAGVVYADGSVWVASQALATVSRLDPRSGTLQQTIHVGNGPTAMAAGPGVVWVANALDSTVSRIDTKTNGVSATVPVGDGPDGIAVARDAVWVSNRFGGTLSKIDPVSAQVVKVVNVQNAPRGVAVAGDGVWVAAAGAPAGAHRGGTLVVGAHDPIDLIDPALTYSPNGWSLVSNTNDGLVAFQRVSGAEGGTLVPDLAVALPPPTDGGRTYAFQLRPGIHYSTGAAVRASDLRFSLERAFRVGVPRPDFYTGIVGGAGCAEDPVTCDLSKGVVTDDHAGTVTFHLTAPDPEFLDKLALPFAVALPPDTPLEPATAPLAATGPYVITTYVPSERIVLSRNPQFREWSEAAQPDGFPDRIEVRIGFPVEHEIDLIAAGKMDFTFDTPPPDRLRRLRTSVPEQVHTYPFLATSYYVLNSRVPPFDSLDARRAVNFALDRGATGDPFLFDAEPTCQMLPPNVPGYRPYCPYTVQPNARGTWTAPDLAKARRLVRRSGTRGSRITIWTANGLNSVEPVKEMLEALGYPTTVETKPNGLVLERFFADSSNRVQMAPTGWIGDFPAPSTFLDGLLSCGSFVPSSANNLNHGGFCDPHLDRLIAKAEALQLTDPAAAIEAWARADRYAADQAPLLFVDTPHGQNFVSERLGGFNAHPEYGPLLDQLWVR